MNTNSKYRKTTVVILAVVLAAFLAVGAWLSLFAEFTQQDSENTTDAIVSNTAATQIFREHPNVMADTEELASAYAQKLGLAEGEYTYRSTSILKVDSNGTWTGMADTTVISNYVHLLLPNKIKKIAINIDSAIGIKSVKWVSITADKGSQLAELERGTSNENSCFGGIPGGWLERVDLTQATNLKTIPSYTFRQCDRLYDIALPDTLTSIQDFRKDFWGGCRKIMKAGLTK